MKADQQTFIKNLPFKTNDNVLKKQGRIHGNPVAGGWAGAVMRKPHGIQKCDGRTPQYNSHVYCGIFYYRNCLVT